MWYSVELLESGSLFVQSVEQRKKHGCKGKVLITSCLYEAANQIREENS